MKKLLVALIAAAFAATAFAQAPKSTEAPATKAEKSEKSTKAKSEKKAKSTKAKSDKKSSGMEKKAATPAADKAATPEKKSSK
jgi:Ni/Co efflux regulator RcnB